ncbi:MAG: insulinase family protein [Planctomycetaceae bacterium]|nr:insulinase family protein [Planctomycetaceae bacterium]
MHFDHVTLENGLTIIAETNPRAHSAAVGFFVRTGSRDETPEISGVSHFLEHMAFKGNGRFTADDVNRIFDEVGARYNASTSEETTLFYAAVIPEYVGRTFELLAALLYPSLRDDDFETEKQVILEEIGMYEDMPAYVANEHAMRTHFSGHPLGMSILGPAEVIRTLTSEQMRSYHRRRYCAGNITLAGTGRIELAELVEFARTHCGHWPGGTDDRDTARPPRAGGTQLVVRPQSQQQHVVMMAAGPPASSPLRFAAELVAIIIGDGQGSRLYWELVDPGHVESADLSFHDFDGCGAWVTYFCCRPDEAQANLARVREMYAAVMRDGVEDDELERAGNKAASRIVLQSERPIGRLSSLGANWVYRREYRSVRDDLQSIAAVTRDDIRQLLNEFPLPAETIVTVGPLEEFGGN